MCALTPLLRCSNFENKVCWVFYDLLCVAACASRWSSWILASMRLLALPDDILLTIFSFVSPATLAIAASTCTSFPQCPSLWEQHYRSRWPRWSLLDLLHDESSVGDEGDVTAPLAPLAPVRAAPPRCWQRRRFARRIVARRRDTRVVPGEYTFEGSTTDGRTGNVTPTTATATITGLLLEGTARSQSTGQGEPTVYWTHGHVGACRRPPASSSSSSSSSSSTSSSLSSPVPPAPRTGGQVWNIMFRETTPTNRGWLDYDGIVSDDGLSVSGTFHWSLIRRIGGTFQFTIRRRSDATQEC